MGSRGWTNDDISAHLTIPRSFRTSSCIYFMCKSMVPINSRMTAMDASPSHQLLSWRCQGTSSYNDGGWRKTRPGGTVKTTDREADMMSYSHPDSPPMSIASPATRPPRSPQDTENSSGFKDNYVGHRPCSVGRCLFLISLVSRRGRWVRLPSMRGRRQCI